MHINSDQLSLTLSDRFPAYQLASLVFPNTQLTSQMEIILTIKGKRRHFFQPPLQIRTREKDIKIDAHFGQLLIRRITYQTVLKGMQVVLQVGLCTEKPMAVLKAEVINNSVEDVALRRITLLKINTGNLHLGDSTESHPAFYSHGWQSWSATGTYGLNEKQHTSFLDYFQNPMVVNPDTPKPRQKNHFSGDMFGILGDRSSRIGLLAGFLSQKRQFGSLEAKFSPDPSLQMWANGDGALLQPGNKIETDWGVLSFIHLDDPDPFGGYDEAVALQHQVHSAAPVPVGWCSWYHFYQDISEETIAANLQSVERLQPKLPLRLLQIDDGFQHYAGDWFDIVPEFPNGLKPLVEKAKSAGLTPGLWLAPFIVHPKANLVRQHPDWLLRDKHGKPVNAGFVWNAFTYALDLTHPDALAYACEVIRTAVKDWGFDYLKLDFLYAAALDGVYQDPTLTRAQVLRKGFEALRRAAGPDTTLLACGCPLGSALGLFEAMRIGADVSGYWEPHFPPVSFLLKKEPHMPAARNALQNILTRAPLHRRWWINDPDCLLVREDTDLSLPEVQTLAAAIGLTGGSLLLSDDLPELSKDRLRLAQVLLPVIGQRARVMDGFDAFTPTRLRLDLDGACGSWHLLAHFNWEEQPASLTFSPRAFDLPQNRLWWLREFWTGLIGQMGANSPLTFQDVPAHGVRVAAARSYDADQPAYLGSDLHLSQGLEISEWRQEKDTLHLKIDLGREASGRLHVYLPWQPAGAWFKGKSHMLQEEGRGIYSIGVKDADKQRLQLKR